VDKGKLRVSGSPPSSRSPSVVKSPLPSPAKSEAPPEPVLPLADGSDEAPPGLLADPKAEADALTEREKALMARVVTGDRDAYAELFSMYTEKIRRLGMAILHSESSAEDLIQETFVKGMTHLDSYRGEGSPASWLTAIALNVCRHHLRDSRSKAQITETRNLEEGKRLFRPRTRGIVTRVSQSEDERRLALAMGFLTDAQREVIVLRYQQGLPFEEIGVILGLRCGAVRALAHRAKMVLRKKLGLELPDEEMEAV
jgi:RNA polymerase sigma-70 factor (ECF subfamily)